MPDSSAAALPIRVALSKKTRFEIFKRDGFTCQYCGAHPPGIVLHVDHIIAVSAGGSNRKDNLVTSCESCNQGKGARDLRVAPESLAEKAERIRESEAQLKGYQKIMQARADRIEMERWRVVGVLFPGEDRCRRDYLRSIGVFIERLGIHDVMDSADVAMSKGIWNDGSRFRYFCGCCWAKVTKLEQLRGARP
jgi:HNH endonuclease